MAMEKWSDSIYLVRLADDPQMSDDLVALEQAVEGHSASAVLDSPASVSFNSLQSGQDAQAAQSSSWPTAAN